MRILIAGPGAVGQYCGGKLALAGNDVTFLGREGSPRISDINEQGVRVTNLRDPAQSFEAKARALTKLQGSMPVDLAILATKTYSSDKAILNMQPVITGDTVVMPFLNGVEAAAALRKAFPQAHVLDAFCFMGAALSDAGAVLLNSPERIILGDSSGNHAEQLAATHSALSSAGLTTEVSPDIQRSLWMKFLWSVGIFQWCAVQDCTIGGLLLHDENVARVSSTMAEVVAIAQKLGINISEADISDQIEAARTRFPAVTPSLLQDLRALRPLEYPAFAGYVSRAGRTHGVATPLNNWLKADLNWKERANYVLGIPPDICSHASHVASGTHMGIRDNQQDTIDAVCRGDTVVAVVGDGHGFLGQQISRLAVEAFLATFEPSLLDSASFDVADTLDQAILAADQKTLASLEAQLKSRIFHSHFDSGTTLTGVIRKGNEAWLAHLGDSRVYHISKRTGIAKQVTEDHRWTETDADGVVTTIERKHGLPMSRLLGHHWLRKDQKITAVPDIKKIEGFEPGDILVVCSDGMNVTPQEMSAIVLNNSPEEAVRRLITTSLNNTRQEISDYSLASMDPSVVDQYVIDNTTAAVIF